jgi:mRNA-degrading endonuclease toxin of MazEF toxin-antitoxin module
VRGGEIYRTRERIAERGAKPGFYVVVSRTFVAEHEDVSTVICAPVYGEVLGLTTEVVLGPEDGLPRTSAIRCDFLTLMFKRKLTHFVSTLSAFKLAQLNRALAHASNCRLDKGKIFGPFSHSKKAFSPNYFVPTLLTNHLSARTNTLGGIA